MAPGQQDHSTMSDEPIQVFASVWDALEENSAGAANMRLRSELAVALRAAVETWAVTQAEAARRLGVTQPRLNDLLRGRIARFSLDALVGLAERAGLVERMEVVRRAAARPARSRGAPQSPPNSRCTAKATS
jgi:predicted XRE-type DNA-binding protein